MEKGDKVVIQNKISKLGFGWYSYMDNILGKEVTIQNLGTSHYGDKWFTIEESTHKYSIECIETSIRSDNYEIY